MEELKFLKNKRVLLIVAYSLTMFVGYGAFYTYVTPYLLTLFPLIEGSMTLVLFLLGIASFTGNLMGGFVADRIGYQKSLLWGAAFQVTFILLIFLSQSIMWLSVIFAVFWMMSAWFTGLQLNTGIAQATQNQSSLMISINSSCIQLGTAIGSSLAALVISSSGIQNIVFLTLAASLLTLLMQFISRRQEAAA